MAEKQFGLIKPQKPSARLTAFMSDSESDDEPAAKKKIEIGPGESQKRQARLAQEKALEEDPTIYQYDELYDEMTASRTDAKKAKTTEVKKSKYIERLLVTADQRKKEYERRVERQVQKDRAAEGDMYRDKEIFVTATYRAKLEEMKKAEEAEQREEYLEAIGDVTKQRDLGGFYRHLYEQKMGAPDAVAESTSQSKEPDAKSAPSGSGNDGVSKQKQRSYRRHDSNMDIEDDDKKATATADDVESTSNKVHLSSNIDADSDFSIDSDSDAEPENDKKTNESKQSTEAVTVKKEGNTETSATAANGDGAKEHDFLKPDAPGDVTASVKVEVKPSESDVEVPAPEPAKPKIDIWKKRTIGDAFDAALQRYYERKQLRCQ